jgi:2-polyprenyl-3-methyl-5-hydroxy-6-metoxy-1,4-benzoquinol methylase
LAGAAGKMARVNPQDPQEQEIIESWHSNAAPWTRAIRTANIASRKLVTDQAITAAVSDLACRCILDIGCGEGWLARALSSLGMSVTGVDAVPELVAQAAAMPHARASGSVAFQVQEYASIANRQWRGGPFDAAVCNFSLLGRESVDLLIAALPHYLAAAGYFDHSNAASYCRLRRPALPRRLARRQLAGIRQRFQ